MCKDNMQYDVTEIYSGNPNCLHTRALGSVRCLYLKGIVEGQAKMQQLSRLSVYYNFSQSQMLYLPPFLPNISTPVPKDWPNIWKHSLTMTGSESLSSTDPETQISLPDTCVSLDMFESFDTPGLINYPAKQRPIFEMYGKGSRRGTVCRTTVSPKGKTNTTIFDTKKPCTKCIMIYDAPTTARVHTLSKSRNSPIDTPS